MQRAESASPGILHSTSQISIGLQGNTVVKASHPMSPNVQDLDLPPKTPVSVQSWHSGRGSHRGSKGSPRFGTPRTRSSFAGSPKRISSGSQSRRRSSPVSPNPLAKQDTPEKPEKPEKSESLKLRWKKGKYLGAGAFGKVWLGLNLDTGQLMAVKMIEFTAKDKDIATKLQGLQHEIRMMKGLHHENIVAYYCTERVGASINIFMEFVPGGSIASLIKEFGALSETTVKNYTMQILLALDYLHGNQVVHRDVKAANVLVNVHGTCKLADFGTAAGLEELRKQGAGGDLMGTPAWMAPEVICGDTNVGPACDVWSLGATILEMLTAKQPFAHLTTNNFQLMKLIGNSAALPPLPPFEEPFRSLLLACFQKSPDHRPTCSVLVDSLGMSFLEDSVSTLEEDTYYDAFLQDQDAVTHCGSASFTSSPSHRRAAPEQQFFPPGCVVSGEDSVDLVSLANTEYCDNPGLREDLSQGQLSPVGSRVGWNRGKNRRKPASIDVGQSVASLGQLSRRSWCATTPGSRAAKLMAHTPMSVHDPDQAKIGRHLVGSCLNLMSIVAEVSDTSSVARSVSIVDDINERDIRDGIAKSTYSGVDDYMVSHIDSPLSPGTPSSMASGGVRIVPTSLSTRSQSVAIETLSDASDDACCNPLAYCRNPKLYIKNLCIGSLLLVIVTLVLVMVFVK